MSYRIKKDNLLPAVFLLLVILPPIWSVIFGVLHIHLPSYLFSFFLTLIIILLGFEKRFVVSFSSEKFLFFLFFLWLLIGTQYGKSKIASGEELLNLIYTILIPVLMIEFLLVFTASSRKKININFIEEFAYKFTKIFVWILVFLVILFKQFDKGRYILPGLNNPIWISRLIGMLILILLYCKPVVYNKTKYYFTLFAAFYLMIVFGSRMPMLSVLLIILLIRSYVSSISVNILLLSLFLLFISLGFILLRDSYLFETSFYSIYQRIDIFKQLKNLDFDSIKGIGTGSFGLFFYGKDVESYPHNSFLEFFIGNGLIGLALYTFLIIVFYKSFTLNIVMLLCLYALLNSMTSGNVVGNNLFYILLYFSFYTRRNTLLDHYKLDRNGII